MIKRKQPKLSLVLAAAATTLTLSSSSDAKQVEKVIGYRQGTSGDSEALVVWRGGNISEATWEKSATIKSSHVTDYIEDRERRLSPPSIPTPSVLVTVEAKSELKRSLTNHGITAVEYASSSSSTDPPSQRSVDHAPTSSSSAAMQMSLVPYTAATAATTEPGAPTVVERYVYGKPNPALDHPPTRAQLIKASRHMQPGACVDEEVYDEVTEEYIAWRSSNPILVDIHGISLRRAVKAGFSSDHAETMCRGNTRFLLGCCRLLGYSRHVISLHMFAVEHVVREIQAVLEGRGVLAGRKYQLYQEIRLIIWWMADQMRDATSTAAMILENPRTVLSSYHYVEGLLVHSGSERKRQERLGLQRDTEDLEQGGKWLSESCRLILTKRVEAYFKAPDRLEGGSGQPITIRDAMEFQAHLLLHLLNDNVIPVPRSEIFCKLQIGVSFTWDNGKNIYVIEFRGITAERTKMRTALRINIPQEETAIFGAWINYYRPVLVAQLMNKSSSSSSSSSRSTDRETKAPAAGSDDAAAAGDSSSQVLVVNERPWKHSYLFVKKDGSGPRAEILSATVALQKIYLGGKSATPHRFRAMQATESQQAGITANENRALCAGRQHTPAAAERFYDKVNRTKNASVAELHLKRLREAREKKSLVKNGKSYRVRQAPLPTSPPTREDHESSENDNDDNDDDDDNDDIDEAAFAAVVRESHVQKKKKKKKAAAAAAKKKKVANKKKVSRKPTRSPLPTTPLHVQARTNKVKRSRSDDPSSSDDDDHKQSGGKRKKHQQTTTITITDSDNDDDDETTQSQQPQLITPKNASPVPDQLIGLTDADWGE